MKEDGFKKVVIVLVILSLLVLAFLIIRPIFIAILFGVLLSYIFRPLYLLLHKKIKSETFSAFLVVFGILLLILVPMILLMPVVTRQLIDVYIAMQKINLATIINSNFPAFFNTLSNSADIAAISNSFTSNIGSFVVTSVQKIIFNLPSLLLQTVIVLFTFFFGLRDHDKLKLYFLSVSPFSKEIQNKFYEKFKQVTNSIIYGQLIVGIAQGIIAGIGYFIFGVPNAVLATIVTMLVGIIPVIGPWLVWIPIDIFLFVSGQTGPAIGLLIYGLLVINWVDTLIRPLVVSRMTKMNSALALIGMVGGLYVFGIIGLILGPLILAYLLLIAEFFKQKRFKSIIIEEKTLRKFPIP
jgi:predicted PurR-regulated permease PerM